MEKLKKQITITPAFDKRSDSPKKDYGIGSCLIFFAVIGSKGAITVSFGTNWFLPSTVKEYKEVGINKNRLNGGKDQFKTKIDLEKTTEPIRAWSWDYHSKKQKYKEQTPMKNCQFIGKCYCDGSFLRADKYLTILLEKGSDSLFKQLEKDYNVEFKNDKRNS